MSKRSPIAKMAVAALMVLVLAAGASAQHAVYLEIPNTIPVYCQEHDCWCGACTGQMILQGYPGGVKHIYTQTDVWNTIQNNKDDCQVDWCTDPEGLQKTLLALGGGAGGAWAVAKNASAASLMHDVLYWVTKTRCPAPVLVFGFGHWVMIDGFRTDADPTQQQRVVLQMIEIVDPWNSPCPTATHGGFRILITGSSWYKYYWCAAGDIPGSKWNGNFIALLEPLPAAGVADAPKAVAAGSVIAQPDAIQAVEKGLKDFIAQGGPQYAALRDAKPLSAMLVNPDAQPPSGMPAMSITIPYYLVPLGPRADAAGVGAAIVSAHQPYIEEISLFPQPIRYVPEAQARAIVLRQLRLVPREKALTRRLFQPTAQTRNRFLPFWEVTAAGKTVYVNQDGKVFEKLTPLRPGD